MTCGSDRSGMASSLMFLIEKIAAASANVTPRKTRKRFLAENVMIRSIMAASLPRLGDAVEDLHLVAGASAELHAPRLEAALGLGEKQVLGLAGVDHRLEGHEDALGGVGADANVP